MTDQKHRSVRRSLREFTNKRNTIRQVQGGCQQILSLRHKYSPALLVGDLGYRGFKSGRIICNTVSDGTVILNVAVRHQQFIRDPIRLNQCRFVRINLVSQHKGHLADPDDLGPFERDKEVVSFNTLCKRNVFHLYRSDGPGSRP